MRSPAKRIEIGLKLSRGAPIESFRRTWRIADEAGFDHCWAFDHLAWGSDDLATTSPGGASRFLFEGWTLLAAMAEATKRTRIGLLVTGMGYRHPALLAKQAVTVDHLSGGRLEFGIGAGWAGLEHAMFDIGSPDHQVGRLSEGLEVVKRLWTQERANFEGHYYRLRDAVAIPRPIQKPHPPIWIGAAGPMVLHVVARHANVWNWAGKGVQDAVAAGQTLITACREVGRDPREIGWSAQVGFDGSDPAAAIQELQRWHMAGFTKLVVSCLGPDPVRAAEVAAEKILPAVHQLS